MQEASVTLEQACEEFVWDLQARGLSRSTMRDYQSIFRQLIPFAEKHGKTELREVDQAFLRKWRATWTCMASTHQLWITKLKTFFRFGIEAGWIENSPAASLRGPRDRSRPTMPLSRAEMQRLFKAAASYDRERALLMLMRYSGLAIRDATTLRRDAINGNLLTLRRAKSNELVLCSLPDPVLGELNAIADPSREHFFWTGKSLPETVARYWRSRLQRVARLARVKGFKTHRLRDTFAVELLLAGVGMEDVSALLGHGSIRVTERHYAPWNTARRDRLVAIMGEVNARDETLKELSPPVREGQGTREESG